MVDAEGEGEEEEPNPSGWLSKALEALVVEGCGGGGGITRDFWNGLGLPGSRRQTQCHRWWAHGTGGSPSARER